MGKINYKDNVINFLENSKEGKDMFNAEVVRVNKKHQGVIFGVM